MAPDNTVFFKGILLKAFFYIAYADGKMDERERSLGESIIKKEQLNKNDFEEYQEQFKNGFEQKHYQSLINDLKQLNKNQQITIIAYMSNVANSNGFMDPAEWKIIYNLYKNELHLNLDDVLNRQKELPPFVDN